MQRIGIFGFLFFLIKGIIWLFIFYFSGKFYTNSIDLKNAEINTSVFLVESILQNNKAVKLKIYAVDSIATPIKIVEYVNKYLELKAVKGKTVLPHECVFLKLQTVRLDTLPLLKEKGYFIEIY